MEYIIKTRNHWWFDSGLVGLYVIASQLKKSHPKINVKSEDDGVVFICEDTEELRGFLKTCYEELASRYYNISNESQKERSELVGYDVNRDELYSMPKRQPIPPIAKLISGKSWDAVGLKIDELDDDLQNRVKDYMSKNKKKLFGNKTLLTEPQTCHDKKIIILPEEKKKNKVCTLCGKEVSKTLDATQLTYMLYASKQASRSFHSSGKTVDKICWECAYIAKFVYEAIYYKYNNGNITLISLYSPNFKQMIDLHNQLGCTSVLREFDNRYFFNNIGREGDLLSTAKTSYEMLWSLYVDKFQVLKQESQDKSIDFWLEILQDIITTPAEIFILTLAEKGQTFVAKQLISYQDSSYMYRLIDKMIEREVDLKKIFIELYEKYRKNAENLERNRILEKCLNKHSILLELEGLSFKKVMNGYKINMKNMIEFVKTYELIVKEDIMNKDQINIAVKLGKQIVLQAYETAGNKDNITKKIKGDLFSLRKARTLTDFLNQINTLQFRYGISVSATIGEGILDEVPFEEFKAYCVLGALNVYNMKQKKGVKANE